MDGLNEFSNLTTVLVNAVILIGFLYSFWRFLLTPITNEIKSLASRIEEVEQNNSSLHENKVSKADYNLDSQRLLSEMTGFRNDMFNFHRDLLSVVNTMSARIDNIVRK